MYHIIKTADDITPAWLTHILQQKDLLSADQQVTSLSANTIGTGQMGSVARITPTYSEPCAAPETLIAKLAATNETSRQTGIKLGVYEAEVRFYEQIADTVDMRTPHCWLADFDHNEGWFTLLLEDLGDYETGNVLTGGSVERARLAIDQLVKLHTSRWNDTHLSSLDWLTAPRAEQLFGLFTQALEPFKALFANRISPELLALAEQVIPKATDYVRNWQGPKVIQHGDYRLDNMLFGTTASHDPVVVVDWQTLRLGPPMLDLAFYLGTGLSIEDRRQHEASLVKGYHQALLTAGITDYSWEQCWKDYRLHTLYGFYMAVGTSVLVEQTERGLEMYTLSLVQHGSHALDLNAADFL